MNNQIVISEATVRSAVDINVSANRAYRAVHRQGSYAIGHGEDEHYLFLWLKVGEDKGQFAKVYREKHGSGILLAPGSVEHLSRQDDLFRDSGNPQFHVVFNHVPYDITDEELSRVISARCQQFGGEYVKFDQSQSFDFK